MHSAKVLTLINVPNATGSKFLGILSKKQLRSFPTRFKEAIFWADSGEKLAS